MAVEVILPRVDMDMTTGRLTRWFVAEGAFVEKGQPLFEIETDKAAMEIEAAVSGILRAVLAEPGDELPVGTVVALIVQPGEAFSAPGAPSAAVERVVEDISLAQARPRIEPSVDADLRATPKARRLARERGLDLAGVAGSGPRGRIQARDVTAPARTAASLNRLWLTRGPGAPLALIHGFGADLNTWRPLIGRLKGARPVIALDLPGHGRSPLAGEVSFEAMVDAVDAALIAEGVHEAHFVGHSLGGAIAIALAVRRAALARSLTLIAPAGLGPELNGAFFEGFLSARSESDLAPWMRMLATDEGALGSAMAKTTMRQRRDDRVEATQSAVAAALFPEGAQAFSLRETLGRYAGPTKIIFGQDDRIIPAAHAFGLSGAIALHLFAGVGHMPHFEARADVARLIEENAAAGD